tara:strand:+ start:7986 stop:9812 length:1827 start_codon:yes stop_codon:yes gene_type:complete
MSSLKFMLAKDYIQGKHDVTGWYMSEKFDGYRACYCPKDNHFYSRQNKPFNAPEWFLQAMPPRLMDGELWIGRNRFQDMGAVRKKVPLDEEWLNITFQVYDMPEHPGPFSERIKELSKMVKLAQAKWNRKRTEFEYPFNKLDCPLVLAKQIPLQSLDHLDQVYKEVLQQEGEGVMLKDPNSPYEGKRSSLLLKYKPNFDEEAIIIDYKPGQGKYTGMLGGFICKPLINHDTYSSIDEDEDHIFAISGMDDAVRESYQHTHPIGTIISYEHSGKTNKGKPRFGRYTRIRTDVKIQQHIQEDSDIVKQRIATCLKALGDHCRRNGEGFKASAYYKAIQGIQTLDTLTESSVRSVKGIGSSLSQKIMEIIHTGSCSAYDKIQSIVDYKKDLLNISGVGPKKAGELVKMGITTIDSLRQHPEVTTLLNEKQLIGLKYYEDILERIPQQEIDGHKEYLETVLHKLDPHAEMTIAGSYRRRAKDSGDIDILLKGTPALYKKFIDVLQKEGYLYETLAKGAKKYFGMGKLPECLTFRRIDIMITKPQEYPFAVLYFTGSKEFNTLMRQHALDRGLSMNEYSLKDVNTKEPVDHVFQTERDIFDYLEYTYVDPWKR